MIALQPVRTEGGIPAGFRGSKREDKELRLLMAKRDGTLKALFDSKPWGPAKDQLRTESRVKCAYCESPAESQHGDVEHLRPKSIWWWLACCYDNYVFSCQICNQSFKGDKFPLATAQATPLGEPKVKSTDADVKLRGLVGTFAPDPVATTKGRTQKAYLKDCTREKPLLPHPCQENPEDFFVYEAVPPVGPVRGQVLVRPRKPAHQARMTACEECFGINRERLAEQRWLRFSELDKARKLLDLVPAALKPDIQALLAEMMAPEKSYAGMARYFVREVWQVPGL